MANTNQLNGRQIRDLTLSNNHVAEDAGIVETKLAIDWTSRYQAALESKLLLDYVQKNSIAVGDGGSVTGVAIDLPAAFGVGSTSLGVTDQQKIIIRDSATGQPIELNNNEIFGKITGTQNDYTISFYTGTFGGTETAVNLVGEFPETTAIDIQYAIRTDLFQIDEAFAMNEKFVDGAADVTEILNLSQLARDIYGASWSLDNDGAANNVTVDGEALSLYDHLVRIHADSSTAGSIDNEIKTQVLDMLLSELAGEGASQVSINDAGNLYTATSVEGALQEVMTDVNSAVSAYGAADLALQANIDAEEVARINADSALQAEVDAIEIGAGLGTDGVYTANATANYINTAVSLKDADDLLDAAIAALDADLQAQVDSNGTDISALQNDVTNLQTLSGVADEATDLGVFAGTTITDNVDIKVALGELEAAINTLESNGGAEVTATHDRESNYVNNLFEVGPYVSLEARLIDIETVLDAEVTNRVAADAAIQAEVDAIEIGAGLGTDGAYTADGTKTYINDATSLFNADQQLDDAIVAVAGSASALQTELDAVELSAGLNADGTKPNYTSINYILAGDSLLSAIEKLDSALSANAAADAAHVTEMASIAGAGLVGILDTAAYFDATTVEGALAELHEEVVAHETALAATTGATLIGITQLANRTASPVTVQGALDILDTDLAAIESWQTSTAGKVHVHSEEMPTVVATQTEVVTSTVCDASLDFFAVYVNGIRQLPTTHFTKAQDTTDTTKVKFTFLDAFETGDNLYIEIVKYDVVA